jgi:hypothetical protein
VATLRAVVEIVPGGADDALWPVAAADEYRWEVLNGETPANVIGTVMAALAVWCRPEDVDSDHEPTATEALGWIAASDYVVIAGGVQAADATATVRPGCCAELNDWRDWADPAGNADLWLGHSPMPWIEQTAGGFLVHQDKEQPSQDPDPVELATDALPGLVADLQADLLAFLTAAERWAADITADPDLAAAVAANIDRQVGISAPRATH